MTAARDKIIETTCLLLESQGYHATGLNQIVRESGAPKGSLYYYFPEGKEEIVEEAIRLTSGRTVERIRANLAVSTGVGAAVRQFVTTIAYYVEASGFQSGGPLMIVAMETANSSERLNRACREAYQQMQAAFRDGLAAVFPPERAEELAVYVMACIEGGIILSRTYHTGDPLRQIGLELERSLTAAADGGSRRTPAGG